MRTRVTAFFSDKRVYNFFHPLYLIFEYIESFFYYLFYRKKNFFVVVSCTWNTEELISKCLQSVYAQNYDKTRYKHILINDASTDNTDRVVRQWLKEHPDHNVEYILREKNVGGCINTAFGFLKAKQGSIVLEVNGDDWLPDKNTLSFLNRVYNNPRVWLTYGTMKHPNNKVLYLKPITNSIKTNNFREGSWIHHLRTFRSELYTHVDKETMIDPLTKQPWTSAWDQANYLAMLELAGFHSKKIHRITYVYNINDTSECVRRLSYESECRERIKKTLQYQPLKQLCYKNENWLSQVGIEI